MRSYLLGTLEPERSAELETGILWDPEAYQELLFVEEELIDQYVAGSLSKTERQQFETHFLITAERQKNLRFGQLLKRYFNSQAVPALSESVPVRQVNETAPEKRFFLMTPVRLAFSAVVLTLLVITLLCWLDVKKPAKRTAQLDSSQLVIYPLLPGSVQPAYATTQHVSVPPEGFNVKLELEVANPNFKNYKSELFRENKPVQIDKLSMETKGEHHVVPLTITGQMLSPGDYQVKLSGVSDSGQDEFIDNYSFRVTK